MAESLFDRDMIIEIVYAAEAVDAADRQLLLSEAEQAKFGFRHDKLTCGPIYSDDEDNA